MHSINQKIQQIMNKYSKKRRYRALAAVLSLAVVFSVCGSLIKPAISASDSENIGISAYSDSVLSNDFSDSITDAVISVTGQASTTRVPALVSIKYELAPGFVEENENPLINNSITYQLPANIEVPADKRDGDVSIAGGNGTYHIDSDGLVIITFPESFLEAHRNNVIIGWIDLDCEIVKSEGNDQDSENIIFNTNISADVSFAEKQILISKEATNNEDGTITWKLIVDNQPGENLNGFTITDTMFDENTSFNTSVGTYDPSSKQFTFGKTDASTVVLEYTTKIEDYEKILKGGSVDNKATLTDTDNNQKTVTKNVNVNPLVTIEKNGSAISYGENDSADISWTVTVDNPCNYNLGGYKIQDSKLSGATDIKVNGEYVNVDGDTITLPNTTDGTVTITYNTKATDDSGYSNTATLQPPTPINDPPKAQDRVPKAIDVYKTGSTANGSGKIEWTLTLVDNTGDSSSNFNGYIIDDPMLKEVFANGEQNGISISPEGSLTSDSEGLKLTFDNPSHGNVTITYSTDVVLGDGELSTTVQNTVGISGNGHTAGDSEEVKYSSRNDIYKTSGGKNISKVKDEDGKVTSLLVEIPWTVTYKQDAGDFAGQTISDVITVDKSGITSSYTDIAVKFEQNADGNFNIDGSNYTLTDNGGSFTITFDNSDYMKTVTGVQITYTTVTELMSLTEGDENVDVNFENTAEYNGYPATASAEYTVINVPPYKKYDYNSGTISDKNTGVTEVLAENLEKVTLEGKDYYVFNWAIEINPYLSIESDETNAKGFVIKDTLPAGMILYQDSSNDAYNTDNPVAESGGYKWIPNYTYDKDSGVVEVTIETRDVIGKSPYILYKTLLPVEYLNNPENADSAEEGKQNTFSFENTVQSIGEKPVSQTQRVVPDPTNDVNVISKTMVGSGNDGTVRYRVEVNKGAEDLVKDSDVLKVMDKLSTADLSMASVNANLKSVTVTNADTNEPIELSDPYGYVFDNEPTAEANNKKIKLSSSDNLTWTYNGNDALAPGTTAKVRITRKEGETLASIGGFLRYDLSGAKKWETGWQTPAFDSSGVAEFEFTVPEVDEGGEYVFSVYTAGIVSVEIINNYNTYEYAAKLELNVPDNTHLYIDYEYSLYDVNDPSRKVTVANVATAQADDPKSSDRVTSEVQLSDKSSAGAESSNWIEFNKVDSGNFNVKLSGASFKLFRYDVENSKWQIASDIDNYEYGNYTYDGEDGKELVMHPTGWTDFQFNSDSIMEDAGNDKTGITIDTTEQNKVYNINLEASRTKVGKETKDSWLYMLVEVKSPLNYISSTEPLFFAYQNTSDTLIELAQELTGNEKTKVQLIEAQTSDGIAKYNYTNEKEEDTSITLPETGGIGTMPYFLAGGAMIFGGMAYYYISKRRFKKCRRK